MIYYRNTYKDSSDLACSLALHAISAWYFVCNTYTCFYLLRFPTSLHHPSPPGSHDARHIDILACPGAFKQAVKRSTGISNDKYNMYHGQSVVVSCMSLGLDGEIYVCRLSFIHCSVLN